MEREKKRRWFQAASALGVNIYLPAWLHGQIFRGAIKGTCVPVLNCYSCPSAVGACPIGAAQNFMASMRFNISAAQNQFGLYVFGFLGFVGSLVGRIPCGWLCPFGFMQELVHKIPSKKFGIPKILTFGRYLLLALFVLLLPLLVMDEFGFGQTWFCKWICPAGTLEAGIPLAVLNTEIRGLLAFMFGWKLAILVLFLVWMVFAERPFCRTACPLGAVFGFFNKVSLFRMSVDEGLCTLCDDCVKVCPVGLKFYDTPNSSDCIRCLKCVKSCNFGAISYEFWPKKGREAIARSR
jgi:polyferredoxin